MIIYIACSTQMAMGEASDQLILHFPNGKINWTQSIIEAVGYEGPPPHYKDRQLPAIKVAHQQALKTLYGIVQNIRIDGSQTVAELIQKDGKAKDSLKEIIKKSDIIEKKVFHDGSAKVSVQLKIQGALAQLVLPPQIKYIETVKTVLNSSKEPFPSNPSAFTGIIIDATGFEVQPALAPSIFNESGQEIYGGTYASREFAVQRGLVIYVKEVNSEHAKMRIQDNPIKIKALRAKKPNHCNLIISDADASQILGASEHLSFLKKCQVVVMVDDAHPSDK